MAPGQYAQAGDAALGEPIGSVETADGGVTATRVDGSTVTLSVGSPVFQGDVLETGGGGAVGIVFVDPSTFSLDENGRMVLDEMVFDPDSGSGTSAFSVVQGVFTFVSGQIAQSGSDAMTVTTPVMSIGIRGTKVAGVAAAEGEDNTVTLLANDDGSVGEIALTNGGGVILLNVANQTSTATSFSLPPAAPIVLAAAAVQNLYGDALNALPPSPPLPNQQQAAPDAAADGGAAADDGAADEEADDGEEEDAADDGEAVDGEGEGEEDADAADDEEGDGEAEEAEPKPKPKPTPMPKPKPKPKPKPTPTPTPTPTPMPRAKARRSWRRRMVRTAARTVKVPTADRTARAQTATGPMEKAPMARE